MLELPMKELLRIDEVGAFFSVSDRTIRLWAEHGHLEAVKIVGSIRITRESALKCRFASQKVIIDADIDPDEMKELSNNDGILLQEGIQIEKSEPIEEAIPAKRGRPRTKTESLSP